MYTVEIEKQEVSESGAGNGYAAANGFGIQAVTAEEIGANVSGAVAVPAEYQEAAKAMAQQVKNKITTHVNNNVARVLATQNGAQPAAGEVVDDAGYEYWDLLALSPQQFIVPPFVFRPHKIVAGGEFVVLTAVLFINPLPTTGGGPSATMHLGDRDYRVRFEQMDLTNVTNGLDITFTGTFPSPAPPIVVFQAGIFAPNPGPNPQLVEMNVTADITTPNQPYAAFATQWFDIEEDPGWPVPRAGGLRHLVPLRYLIYPK